MDTIERKDGVTSTVQGKFETVKTASDEGRKQSRLGEY